MNNHPAAAHPRLTAPLAALAFVLVSSHRPSAAAELALRAPNLAPQHLLHLTPPPDQAAPVPEGSLTVAVDAAYANVFVDEGAPGTDSARLDMEVARVGLRVARGLGRGLEVGAEVPYLWMGGGFFDGFISAYHRDLGLPNGDRGDVGPNEFKYEIDAGGERYAPDGGAGLGDATVWVKAALPSHGATRWAARGMLKLPTGRPGLGLGSGRTDAALGLLAAVGEARLELSGSADVVYLSGSPDDALPLSTRWAVAASVGAGLSLGKAADAVAQLSYFATPYATGLSEVDRDVLMLAAGLRFRVGERMGLTVGFTEDLRVGASPDFEVFLSLQEIFGGLR